MLTLTQATPLLPYFSCISTRCGHSFLQGGQNWHQTSSTTTLPRKASRRLVSCSRLTTYSFTSPLACWLSSPAAKGRSIPNARSEGPTRRIVISPSVGGQVGECCCSTFSAAP